MPKLEEADIAVKYGLQEFLESVTSVKRLSIIVLFNNEEESMYCSCIVFNQLQRLKLSICNDDWSKLLFRFLKDSPKLRVLNLDRASRYQRFDEYEYERTSWDNEWSVTPNCWLKTLETFEFSGCKGRPQERELS
ncbi:PREDICTED: putative FBD-associated F-box protein At5g56700 [Brassica oleracea var. oleracea]|uniref:putative FBD-associated F-box protein At5g56700 n=1 Tax=Brassica oleracea var. oleracea TaxID=109376 RepID=UPI0006A73A6F|nr:PREDICTED: putative FBD-associated F-box protein At5g56700 [Brassica oleracea var. oleracea]